jgi:hypothetical protein
MIHHFNCQGNPDWVRDPLVFDWDDETGEIAGPSADYVLAVFKDGRVRARPTPWGWNLTSTRNRTDIAAVIGYSWVLPPELADAYPKPQREFDGLVRDLDGNVIGRVTF